MTGGPGRDALPSGTGPTPESAADDPLDLLRTLVRIESVNPEIDPAGSGERAIAEAIAEWLERRGFAVELIGRSPQRPSVIAVRRGTGGGRTLLVNGHIDTVGMAGYRGDALEPREEDGRLHGRGTFDMKGGVAAAMVAAARAGGRSLRGDVVLALVADEEFGSTGTEDALARLTDRPIDGAIVTEPTQLQLTVAHRGFAWFRLEVEGVPAHGSQPELGVDAIEHATELLLAIRDLGANLAARTPHPVLGASTVRVSTIEGGTDAATVAARCTVTIERRTLPGETPDGVLHELERAIAARSETVGGIRYQLEQLVSRPAFETPPDALVTSVVERAFRAETGSALPRRGDPWWTDAGLLAEAGIPTVLFGVDGGGAHASEEWVDIASLYTLTRTLEGAIVDFCG